MRNRCMRPLPSSNGWIKANPNDAAAAAQTASSDGARNRSTPCIQPCIKAGTSSGLGQTKCDVLGKIGPRLADKVLSFSPSALRVTRVDDDVLEPHERRLR